MLEQEINIDKQIRDYGKKVKTQTVEEHIAFLKDIGDQFAEIKGSDFQASTLSLMESLLDKIIVDIQNGRHENEKIDQTLLDALEELISLNIALVRGTKKNKDDLKSWGKQLREYIKILRNLSIAALLIASNETTIKKSNSPESQMKVLFDWSVKG